MATDALAETQEAPLAEPITAERPLIGERYEILGLLGSGGMGNVYRVKDRELDEVVALKVLRPEVGRTEGALDRFRREVKLARKVTHPNVARMFDIGDLGGERVLTMELIEGEPLSALLEREAPLSPARTIEIGVDICRGVAAAHASGVVHRDLKPANVLLSRNGRVVVTDFGIARAAASNELAMSAAIVGTPVYMAPEQVEGSKSIDGRADVYAFGAMLFEMLTGEYPWKGDSVIAVAAARLIHPPPDPRARRADVHEGLATVVMRAMARRPEERFPSMDVVATELQSIARAGAISMELPRERLEIPGAERRANEKRVAVLPFQNLGIADDAHVAVGLTEDLIDTLSTAEGLRVCSRGLVMRFKGSERDPRDVGRELGVHVVVEGSVRKTPAGVRIQARLVSVSDGFQLWARRFDASPENLLAVNDDVAKAVAHELTVDFVPEKRGPDMDALTVDLYLRAKAAYHGFGAEQVASAVKDFERALALAPDDPRILAGYVTSCSRESTGKWFDAPGLLAKAERAIELAPTLSEAHVAKGVVLFHSSKPEQAIRSFRRALACSRTNAEAHDQLGRILVDADREEAPIHLGAALALEPTFEIAKLALARYDAFRGDWQRAENIIATTKFPPVAARFLFYKGDVDRALALATTQVNGALTAWALAIQAAAEGQPATRVLEDVAGTRSPRNTAFIAQMATEVASAFRRIESSLDMLEESIGRGLFDIAWMDRCPALAAIREEPRFKAARGIVAERAQRIVDAYLAKDA